MPTILSETYRCTAQGLLYRYDVLWEGSGTGTIQWEARISRERQITSINGSISAIGPDDESDLVRARVQQYIEAYSKARIGEAPGK